MPLNSRPSSDLIQEKYKARQRMAMMKTQESLAERSETAPTASLRAEYAESYRKIIGVEPQHRELFRDAMERVSNFGGMSVQDVIDLIRLRYYANGSSRAGSDRSSAN